MGRGCGDAAEEFFYVGTGFRARFLEFVNTAVDDLELAGNFRLDDGEIPSGTSPDLLDRGGARRQHEIPASDE